MVTATYSNVVIIDDFNCLSVGKIYMAKRPAESDGAGGQTDRRGFLSLVGGVGAAAAVGTGSASATGSAVQDGTVGSLSFSSTASQLAPDKTELTDDSVALVRAEPTAINVNREDSSDEGVIYEDADIPLVSEDGSVVGFGTVEFVADGTGGFRYDNEQFLVNLFEEKMGEDALVAWDEGHGQFWSLDNYQTFAAYAADEGYDLQGTSDLFSAASDLTFPSTASQVAPSGDAPLKDPSNVVVWAEQTAQNSDATGDDSYIYGDDEQIPLVSRAGNVVGIGSAELINDDNITEPNEQFVVNLLADTIGDSGTVLWDDAHESFWVSNKYGQFGDRLSAEGYNFSGIDDFSTASVDAVDQLEFFSTASLLNETGEVLTDDERVAVWAEPTATNESNNGDYVSYPDDTDIPLVAVDGSVVGVGAQLVPDDSDADQNREFLVNVWTDRVGEGGTVLFDESHGQSRSLDDFSQLVDRAESAGFTVESVGPDENLTDRLDDGDALMVVTNNDDLASGDGFTDDELDALSEFVANGNGLFLHDNADFEGESTAVLDEIAAAVDAKFRFNTDQVVDEENSGFAPFVPQTSNFNDSFDFFGDDSGGGPSLGDADALFVPTPSSAYTDEELTALEEFVADGGAVFMLDQSDYRGFDETGNLNEIASTLDAPFAFNPDQVTDGQNNAGAPFRPTTTNFNDGFDVFEDLIGVGLDNADGAVVTTPPEAFTDDELDTLAAYVDDGGALFLFDQSEFGGYEETANLNAIADALDLAFRFNGDQVEDSENNAGPEYIPLTANYDASDDVFDERENGIGVDFQQGGEYFGQVVNIFDGDTFEVEFDSEYGYRDIVRLIGIDTAETGSSDNSTEEWFGLDGDDLEHLGTWGQKATEYVLELMAPDGADTNEEIEGRQIRLTFDEAEPLRGNFGRLLMEASYDEEAFQPGYDEGSFETSYNREMVETGRARVYSSGFGAHDEYAAIEQRALADRTGVWSAADFEGMNPVRNDPVEEVFVPRATAVTESHGRLRRNFAVVRASDTAEADLRGSHNPALVAADWQSGVVVSGGLLMREDYYEGDGSEEFPDVEGYQNFPLVTNLMENLSSDVGPVLIDGGHGQFAADGALSLEDCKFLLRYLEGVGTRFRQVNDIAGSLPEEPILPRALVITAPTEPYSYEELAALQWFQLQGGVVVLMGSAAADADQRANLNEIADALGTPLRLTDTQVTDPENNVADNPELLTTATFNDRHFEAFDPVDLVGENVVSYLRRISNDEDRIDRDAIRQAIDDWRSDDIDRWILDTAFDLWFTGDSVVPEA